MGLDIRIPIGLMFSVFGLILVLFGLIGDQSIYSKSLGMNVNCLWGSVLLLFGIVMLVLGKRGSSLQRDAATEPAEKPVAASVNAGKGN